MTNEGSILRVLNLLTLPELQHLPEMASDRANDMRSVLADDNVVAVGIAEKIHKQRATGVLSLTFYVRKKVASKRLSAAEAVPPAVPPVLGGSRAIPTDVVEIGELVPQAAFNVTRSLIQPGYSIGHRAITAGTLGAIVTKGSRYHLLSNSHVIAKSGRAKAGDAILYPGKVDGGILPRDRVGSLVGFHPFITGGEFVNRVDCAIADVLPTRLAEIRSDILRLGLPKAPVKPRRGMKIMKMGRTTKLTTGTIRDVNFRFVLSYPGVGKVGFIDQVFCTRYSDEGDSGSLVLEYRTNQAVGLHFAGANGGSVFNPIMDVLAALSVKLVTTPIKRPK